MTINIGIIVGHTKKSSGAVAYNGVSEYTFNSLVVDYINKLHIDNDLIRYHIFRRDNEETLEMIARNVELVKCDLSLELHFNSTVGTAKGCECLISNVDFHSNDEKYANILTDKLAHEYGIVQRHIYKYSIGSCSYVIDGVKRIINGDRGWHNLFVMKTIGKVKAALLFEPCFAHMNTSESKSIIENPERYANFLVSNITDMMGCKTDNKNSYGGVDTKDIYTHIKCTGFVYRKPDDDFVVVSNPG